MSPWYLNKERFEKRIIKHWKKTGFPYHAGHIQLLKYSYQTLCFWSIKKGKQISEKNKSKGQVPHPTLF